MFSQLPTLVLSLLIAFLSACTTSPGRIDERETENFKLELRDVSRDGITAFDWEVYVDAPPWRTWNLLRDIQESYSLSRGYSVVAQPQWDAQDSFRFILKYQPHWYFPAITGVVAAREVPRDLAVEAECVNSSDGMEDCYFKTVVIPLDGGKRSIVHMHGYLKLPWYMPFGSFASLLRSDIRQFASAFPYRLQRTEYATPDPRFPWTDLNAMTAEPAAPGPAVAAGEPERASPRRRIAFQRLETYGAAETLSSIAAVSGDYLTSLVNHGGTYDVVTAEDVNLLVRYMGERWALLCQNGDACQKRVADLARVDYLLTGGLRHEADEYHLNLVLLDAVRGGSVWRFQRTLAADTTALKAALQAASVELAGSFPRP